MTVHIFGVKRSPGCANFGLKKLANDNEGNFSEDTLNYLRTQLYVDDGLYSAKTVEEAVKLVDEARQLCNTANLRLHKFISNNREVIGFIPESERSSHVQIVDLNLGVLPEGRTLEIRWNTDADSLEFTINTSIDATSLKRRSVLATISFLYDPLGCVSPFVLKGKLILQQMCREDLSWDNPMPIHLEPRWKEWLNDLKCFQN